MDMPKRIDDNQREIVKTFRSCGATVQILSDLGKGCPDLLIGMFGRNFLVEVKNGRKPPSGQKLTEKEELFFQSWKGQVTIIKSCEEAANFITCIIKDTTT